MTARRNISKYCGQDATFTSTRECKFLNALLEAYENADVEGLTTAVVEFDQVTKLDNWKTSILLKIKRDAQESEEPGVL